VIGHCEHSNEPSDSLKGKVFAIEFEVFTVVTVKSVVFWIVTQFILETIQHFGGICCQETSRGRQETVMEVIFSSDMSGSL
jgi:hypothetical protein